MINKKAISKLIEIAFYKVLQKYLTLTLLA